MMKIATIVAILVASAAAAPIVSRGDTITVLEPRGDTVVCPLALRGSKSCECSVKNVQDESSVVVVATRGAWKRETESEVSLGENFC